MRLVSFVASAVLSCFAVVAGPAASQDWAVDFGAGGIVRSEYLGAEEVEALVLPYVAVAYGDRFSFRPGDGLNVRAVSIGDLDLGATANVRFGRDAQVRDDGAPLSEIDDTIEAGLYARYTSGDLSAGLTWLTDLGDAHGGDVVEAEAAWRFRMAGVFGQVGPTARWGSAAFNDAYLATSVAASGGRLPDRTVGDGLQSIGLSANAVRPITPRLSAVGVLSVDRLVGDARDSAIVQDPTQVFFGAFLSYRVF